MKDRYLEKYYVDGIGAVYSPVKWRVSGCRSIVPSPPLFFSFEWQRCYLLRRSISAIGSIRKKNLLPPNLSGDSNSLKSFANAVITAGCPSTHQSLGSL